jgi:hypothetical protein
MVYLFGISRLHAQFTDVFPEYSAHCILNGSISTAHPLKHNSPLIERSYGLNI